MEIRSNISAIPYSAPASAPQTAAAGAELATPAETPSTIVTLQSPAATAAETEGGTEPSPVKSFTYGALGLPEPLPVDTPSAKPENTYFTAGKWVAAAATVGSIVSLLV
ncbi:hypothetical protein ACFPAG_14625 [Vogesella sp. GCM10023246]|uniref:Uncharacterized protein n=2 Tax=Chromobacteriaceae TaxID=1499392 RepID=A0ABV1M6J6_9NEIS